MKSGRHPEAAESGEQAAASAIEVYEVSPGDRQLLATPAQVESELHCVAGSGIIVNGGRQFSHSLQAGSRLRLQGGEVYRLDAESSLRILLRAAESPSGGLSAP